MLANLIMGTQPHRKTPFNHTHPALSGSYEQSCWSANAITRALGQQPKRQTQQPQERLDICTNRSGQIALRDRKKWKPESS